MTVPPLRSARSLMRSDLFRYSGRTDLGTGLKLFARSLPFRFVCLLRLRKSRNGFARLVARVMYRSMSARHGVEIPLSVEIGEGLLIPHLVSIVVNSTSKLGGNCTLSHGVTIASSRKSAAIVGDNVYIGPHACLIEHVIIGDGATIGAAAVVVKDVPTGATVAGNPAKVISMNTPGRLTKNFWSAS